MARQSVLTDIEGAKLMATSAQHSWQPALARVVCLDPANCLSRGYVPAGSVPSWPAKDPGDTLDFVADISQAILGNSGDSIATLDVQISPANQGDLALQASSADGSLAILWFSGGLAGTTYSVTLTIGTNSGRILSRTILLPVISFAAVLVPPSVLTDQTGAPIDTQTGMPITV